ncbi:MAG TPA: hypothetical protein VNI84_19545 [Pyrinomonadaceae bacterium]|nr:hypothetical protein [Pyrinomonadaceae bacterium]
MKQIIPTAILILAFCFAAFAQASENSCPKINVSTRNELARENESVFFIAEVSKEVDRYDVKYNWVIQNAEVLEGQGTRIIRVLRKSDDVGLATLEITGLPKNCASIAVESIPAIDPPLPEKSDEFGIVPTGELRTRLDNFLVELQNNPMAKGLVVILNNQKSINLLKIYNNHYGYRQFDRARISFLITDKAEEQTQLYIIPAGVYNPTFENGLIIKAEDFDKLDKLFRPKPITKKRKK